MAQDRVSGKELAQLDQSLVMELLPVRRAALKQLKLVDSPPAPAAMRKAKKNSSKQRQKDAIRARNKANREKRAQEKRQREEQEEAARQLRKSFLPPMRETHVDEETMGEVEGLELSDSDMTSCDDSEDELPSVDTAMEDRKMMRWHKEVLGQPIRKRSKKVAVAKEEVVEKEKREKIVRARKSDDAKQQKARDQHMLSVWRERERKRIQELVLITKSYEATAALEQQLGPPDMSIVHFPTDKVFLDKWLLLELLDIDDKKGVTYLAWGNGMEVILRVGLLSHHDARITTEVTLLHQLERRRHQHLAGTVVWATHIDPGHPTHGIITYATLYRPGPRLSEIVAWCAQTRPAHKEDALSARAVARIAIDICEILYHIGECNRILLDLNPSQFTFSARARRFFIHDLTDSMVRRPGNVPIGGVFWRGDEATAPLAACARGNAHMMNDADLLEAAWYMLVRMRIGRLPWEGREYESGEAAKKHLLMNGQPNDGEPCWRFLSRPFWMVLDEVRRAHAARENINYKINYARVLHAWRIVMETEGRGCEETYDWEREEQSSDVGARVLAMRRVLDEERQRVALEGTGMREREESRPWTMEMPAVRRQLHMEEEEKKPLEMKYEE